MYQPIFPKTSFTLFLDTLKKPTPEESAHAIGKLIRTHVKNIKDLSILYLLFSLLVKVEALKADNKMTATNLGTCFAPSLFQSGAVSVPIVEIMIKHYSTIFFV